MIGKTQTLKGDVGRPKTCKEAAVDKPQTAQTLKGDAETLNKRNGWKTPNT